MIAARQIANRWYSQVAGMVLVAVGLVGLSVPAPTASLHRLGDKAMCGVMPMISKTSLGRQLISIYAARDASCRRSL